VRIATPTEKFYELINLISSGSVVFKNDFWADEMLKVVFLQSSHNIHQKFNFTAGINKNFSINASSKKKSTNY